MHRLSVVHRENFAVTTRGRGTIEITRDVAGVVARSRIRDGLATVFVHHTSASLIVCENADPTVRQDLETVFARLAPDGDPAFGHDAEGPDDMPAHARSILSQTSIGLPVAEGALDLGTWQGLYLWEHRTAPHVRKVSVTVVG
jgi:secondary thiamine-phosphate synthase enzyme